MSSYFDTMAREIAAAHEIDDALERLAEVRGIEERLFNDVTAITGDREFPDDLRERMLGVLAVKSVYQPGTVPVPQKALDRVNAQFGYSPAVEAMHELHHELASRRVEVRFMAYLSDSPTQNRLLRDEHDAEKAERLGLT